MLPKPSWIERLALGLAGLFIADRLLKLVAVIAFFRRSAPPAPPVWPRVSLIQPLTAGASGIAASLEARARLLYPVAVQHVLICDRADKTMQAVVETWRTAHPELTIVVAVVEPDYGACASKIAKLAAALPLTTGDVLCFIDDDVAPRPAALHQLIGPLHAPTAGATFGVACYTNWQTPWSSLMSAFVNANALLSYVPLVYLTAPFTITGHFFALKRSVFQAAGGLEQMAARYDDDHELARRVRRTGRQLIQTATIYDVDNAFGSYRAYTDQIRRWFTMPRHAMLPHLSRREQLLSGLGSVGNLVPGLVLGLAVVRPSRRTCGAVSSVVAVFALVYAYGERRYLQRPMPIARWPLLLWTALCTPLEAALALATGQEVVWRGQRLRLRGSHFEVRS